MNKTGSVVATKIVDGALWATLEIMDGNVIYQMTIKTDVIFSIGELFSIDIRKI